MIHSHMYTQPSVTTMKSYFAEFNVSTASIRLFVVGNTCNMRERKNKGPEAGEKEGRGRRYEAINGGLKATCIKFLSLTLLSGNKS